jgi:hypothetical protein
MKATVTELGTNVFSGTGFSATAIAELPVGSEVEILTAQKLGGKRWVSVMLADGRTGFMPGETKVSANGRTVPLENAYAKTSSWKGTERRDAKKVMVNGALWFGGGILAIAFDLYITYAAISSRSDLAFPVKPILLLALVAVVVGGFRLVTGILAYLSTLSD